MQRTANSIQRTDGRRYEIDRVAREGVFVIFLQIIGVSILAGLVWLTYYFDKKHEHALCSASFVGLIVYTLVVSAFMSF